MKIKESVIYRCVLCKLNKIIHIRNVEVRKYKEGEGLRESDVLSFSYEGGEDITGGELLGNRPYIEWPLDRWENIARDAWQHLTLEEIGNRIRQFLESADSFKRDEPLCGICEKCLNKKDIKILVDGGYIEFEQ